MEIGFEYVVWGMENHILERRVNFDGMYLSWIKRSHCKN